MKKVLLIAIPILVIAIGVGYYFWSDYQKEKDYASQLSSLLNDIELSTAETAVIGSTYQEYWGKIIDRKITIDSMKADLSLTEEEIKPFLNAFNRDTYMSYGDSLKKGDFNTMIAIVSYAKEKDTATALENYDSITKKLSNLKNPTSESESNYKVILDLYEIYSSFVSLSTDPVGSYIEYSKNLNSTYDSVQSKIKTAKIQIQ